jgi:thiol-disulfide isomerase/thioredoxin
MSKHTPLLLAVFTTMLVTTKALAEQPSSSAEPATAAAPEQNEVIGREAPEIRLMDRDLQETSLSALRGKVVLLNFNFGEGGCDMTCNPDFPILAELQKKHEGEPVEIVSVLEIFNDRNWEEALLNRAITWKTTIPAKDSGGTPDGRETPEKLQQLEPLSDQAYMVDIFKGYNVRRLASNVVVGKDGIILGHFGSLNGSRQDVEAAIAKALEN